MNKIQYIALSGAALLLTAFTATSCDDANDWSTDASYDRLFSSPKISVSANALDAEVTFTMVPNAEYYVIEVSKDSLYDAVSMGSTTSSILYGEDKSIVKSPFTIDGLDSDSKYFLRIKSYAAGKSESLWGYLTDKSFKTRTEQIITYYMPAAEKITLGWPAGSVVDRVEIWDATGAVVQAVMLTADQIAEGRVVVEGLTQLTDYTAVLYKGDVKRGMIVFTTPAKVPDADVVKYLAEGDSINNTLFEEVAAAGHASLTLALPVGSEYYNTNTLNIPYGLSVTFFGLSGGVQPRLGVKSINVAGQHDYIRFENIEVYKGQDEEGNVTTLDYLFNQSEACEVGELAFSNCFIHGLKNTPVRLQGSAEKTIRQLTFSNSLLYGAESRSYSLVHVDESSGKGKIENILFSRSTVVYTGKCFVYSKNTDFTSLILTDCTFSKMMGSGDYLLDCASTKYGPSEGVKMTNCIFGSTSDVAKGIRSSASVDVTNCYQTADFKLTGNLFDGLTDYEGGETALFKDPANRDFTIIDGGFAGKQSCGDPRWYME